MTPAAGYVYVVSLSNGTVKVGRSRDAGKRLGAHKANARTLGLTVTDSWISPLHVGWMANEDALKEIAADLGGVPEGKEAFSGIEFAAVVERARELVFPEPEAAAELAPAPVESAASPEPEPEKPLYRGGRLTPRERAVALAALETGMSAEDQEVLYGTGWLGPVAVSGLLEGGWTVDDVERLSPDGSDVGVDALARAMKAVVRFECDIEILIARKKAAELRREADHVNFRVEMLHEARQRVA